jgi:hypothetical protein
VCIEGQKPFSAKDALILEMLQVVARVGTSKAFYVLEIAQMHNTSFLARPNQYALRFYVPMQVAMVMKNLKTIKHLNCEKQDGLQLKMSVAKLKQILAARTQQRNDDAVEIALDTFPQQLRKSD